MKWLVIAVVAIGLGLGAWRLLGSREPVANNPTETEEPTSNQATVTAPKTEEADQPVEVETPSKSTETTVTYTNDGFSPSQVTISAGGKIKFINQSSRQLWVASDPHPIHSDTPELDNGRGIGTGETYEFTFTQPGSYGFHNHLSSFHLGTVTVE